MIVAGIVAEYNPFHNGHALHIAETRRLTGCDYVIACMVGHFTQRGEPACLSKWDRARMALSCGADAVFELPALHAVRPADAFARGGVAILDGLGADVLSFGSEIADMDALRALARLREHEPEAMSARVKEKLALGMSHARARGEAASEYLGLPAGAVNQPNAALAVEYLRAVDGLGSGLRPLAIPRRGDYHGEALGEYASATAIRAAFARGEGKAALEAIPEAARPWAAPDAMHAMDDMLLYALRGMTPDRMAALPDVGEGLEMRLYRLCRECGGREALLAALKCKRYTRARLSRLLAHALLGMDGALVGAAPRPTYARLIGLRAGAEPLLGELKKRASLPVVSDPTALKGEPAFELECRATDIWSLLHDAPELRRAGREFTERFVRVG